MKGALSGIDDPGWTGGRRRKPDNKAEGVAVRSVLSEMREEALRIRNLPIFGEGF
jgi:hypothetical protein